MEANPSTIITPGSHPIWERCYSFGYEETAAAIVASGKRLIPDQIFYLSTASKAIDFKTNRVSTARRKLYFTVVEGIKQDTSLELISDFGIGKTVDKTLASYFFRGKFNRRRYVMNHT